MTVADLLGVLALAMLEGAVVALPRADALSQLTRLHSPAWAAVLPGAILFGTFAPLWDHAMASTLVVAAAVATPALALVGLIGVARGPGRLFTACVAGVALAALLSRGAAGRLAIDLVTAFGSMSAGVALTRLIPRRWLVIGVALMCAVDVLLLVAGAGEAAAGSMATASAHFHGPEFTQAIVGRETIDYPDLVLAGTLGGVVSGRPVQRRAAATLVVLAATWGLLLMFFQLVPATVPIALTFVALALWRRVWAPRRRPRSAGRARLLARATAAHALGAPAWQPAPCQ